MPEASSVKIIKGPIYPLGFNSGDKTFNQLFFENTRKGFPMHGRLSISLLCVIRDVD